mmetsp:Transcript_15554/g.29355  ORF Transcript_15554/g.29355 Transcript_15554/m.29355 type:complete len:211 (-) Transcript_15554:667-1299(-)
MSARTFLAKSLIHPSKLDVLQLGACKSKAFMLVFNVQKRSFNAWSFLSAASCASFASLSFSAFSAASLLSLIIFSTFASESRLFAFIFSISCCCCKNMLSASAFCNFSNVAWCSAMSCIFCSLSWILVCISALTCLAFSRSAFSASICVLKYSSMAANSSAWRSSTQLWSMRTAGALVMKVRRSSGSSVGKASPFSGFKSTSSISSTRCQ